MEPSVEEASLVDAEPVQEPGTQIRDEEAQFIAAQEATREEDPELPDSVKVQAIIEEFGDIANLMEPKPGEMIPEPEQIVRECKGSLFK